MSSKSRKDTHKSRIPPLSFADKFFYIAAIVFSVVFSFALIAAFGLLRDEIAFSDPDTVAFSSHSIELFEIPFILFVMSSAITFFGSKMADRKAVFGNKKVEYGKEPWDKSVYPFFDKRRKTLYVKPSAKRFSKWVISVWLIALCVTLLLLPLSFFGRDSLKQNDNVVSHNLFGVKSDKAYTAADFSSLTIMTRFDRHPGGWGRWEFAVKIKMSDGRVFDFNNYDFHGNDNALEKMLEIKSRFAPDKITFIGSENINETAKSCMLNEEQTTLLKEIFSQ